jgi:hypothetical protein
MALTSCRVIYIIKDPLMPRSRTVSPASACVNASSRLGDPSFVDQNPLTISRLRELLLDEERALVSLSGERADETYVLERRGADWLVYFFDRGHKRDFRKHGLEDCRLPRSSGPDRTLADARRTTASAEMRMPS